MDSYLTSTVLHAKFIYHVRAIVIFNWFFFVAAAVLNLSPITDLVI